METNSLFDLVREHLKQPEYLHVLLNPLPIYGLATGALALIVALALRSRRAHIAALAIVFVSAASAWPVAEFGEQSYDRVETMSNKTSYAWLDAHAQRATKSLWVFYALAGVALAALAAPWKFPKTGVPLAAATLLLAFVALGVGAWIGYAGGQIRHTEFRSEFNSGLPPEKPGGYEKMRD